MYEDYPYQIKLAITHKNPKPMRLWSEPWCFEYMLEPNVEYQLVAHCKRQPTEEVLLLEFEGNDLIVCPTDERPLVVICKDGKPIGEVP